MAASVASSRRSSSAPASKLPSPTAKSKGKTRRRSRLFIEPLAKQIRILVLFVIAIFVIFIFKVGFPGAQPPLKWVITPAIGFNLTESQPDIKMSELYDEIEFNDIDGGAWKQGWDVQYTGNEWDKRKLRVFVVPHSHNDPGWLRTVEEYYQERSRKILSTIVQALRKNKKRKFIWEEMSYLERWWRDASESEKKDFIQLVKNGQLEIVGGGWVMNDEANAHYYAIIEQITEGNLWLQDIVGAVPQNAWAIDPFGHSPTMAYLLRQMGFKNMLIQRTHYEVKKALALKQNLEFFWRQSWDKYNTTDIFCHMMPFYSYDIPHTCGPEPAVCCQFDYWRLPGFGMAQRCPWGKDPQTITLDNVEERSKLLLDQYKKKSTLYKTNTLLVPLGDDFRYITIAEADLQFDNYQKIFDYINEHPKLKAEVQFGTLEDYFTAVKEEMALQKEAKIPSLSGDFFTYADRQQDYWSGYYVSRPFYKSIDRILEETLRAADIIFSLSLAYCQPSAQSGFPLSFSDRLVDARRALAVFQHHDGVTGTAKNHVVVDYAIKMQTALSNLRRFMAQGVGALLGRSSTGSICKDGDLNLFVPEKEQISHDVSALRKAVDVVNDQVQRVAVYNPLEEGINQIVTVLVSRTDVCVMSSGWEPIESQVSPEWTIDKNIVGKRHRLHWQARVPPMGIQTFFISVSKDSLSCKAANVAKVKVSETPESFACPAPYNCDPIEEEVIEIQNQYQVLRFSKQDGLLKHVRNKADGSEMSMKEDLAMYSSRGSGAYLFHPLGEAKSIINTGGTIIATLGPIVQEVLTRPSTPWSPSPAFRAARLYSGADSVQSLMVEMEYHVELMDYEYNDKEIVVRFDSDLDTGDTFYSDLNGFQTIQRQTRKKIPIQGNYYPMPSLAFLQETEGRRFSVHSRQALGVASLKSGSLEVMLDRRLTRDDDRGLGQGVLDNRPIDVTFHLLLESNITHVPHIASSTPRVPSLLSHRVSAQLSYPMHTFLGEVENSSDAQKSSLQKKFAPLAVKFPCDLHVLSLKVAQPQHVLKPKSSRKPNYAITLHRRGWDDNYCKKGQTDCTKLADENINVFELFDHLHLTSAKVSSLNLLHDSSKEIGAREPLSRKQGGAFEPENVGLISLSPMEIQSIKLDLVYDEARSLDQ